MKRGFVFLSFAVLMACGAKEPKQASSPDNITDDSADPSSKPSGNSSKGATPDNLAPPPSSGKPVKGEKGEAPAVASLAQFQEGTRWGMSHADVTKMFTENGGIIWKDYDEKLAKARVGPEMTALEAEREQQKAAFGRSYIEFKDTPTGYDATALKPEYTYKNRESLMWIQRAGKKRYFFFINDRLWKIYDEFRTDAEAPVWGKTYLEAVNTMNGKLGAQGRVLGADEKKNIFATTVDYKDASSHLRIIDRSSEKVIVISLADNNTISQLASLRSTKAEDPNAIDPTVTAVTNKGLSDPNAANPNASASGKKNDKKPTPAPKK